MKRPKQDAVIRHSQSLDLVDGTGRDLESGYLSAQQAVGLSRLYDLGLRTAHDHAGECSFELGPACVLDFHAALRIPKSDAGRFRKQEILITNSHHRPLPFELINEEIDQFCDHINERWHSNDPLYLSAYALWRLLWIHPFLEGNGSVARMLSYVILCVSSGTVLPGTHTIPSQISDERGRYYRALESADRAWSEGRVDVSEIELMLGQMLAVQLASL